MLRGYWEFIVFNGELSIAWVRRDGCYGCRLYTVQTLGLDGVE